MKDRRDPVPYSGHPPEPERSIPRNPFLGDRGRRRILATLVAGVVIALLGWTVWNLSERAEKWLHGLDEYAIPFRDIELVPEPPEVGRPGREGILSRVKERAGLPDPLPLLAQDLEELRLAFVKYSPWIASVERVERVHPRRLVVHAEYRVPVARIDQNRLGTQFLAIASDGVVIKGDEIKPDFAPKLVRIEGFSTLPEGLPGHFLGVDKEGKIPPDITSAIRLATFLHEKDRSKGSIPRVASINVFRFAEAGLVLKLRRGFWVLWKSAPGEESDDEPKALEKWEQLVRWEELNPDKTPIENHVLVFTKRAMQYVRARP